MEAQAVATPLSEGWEGQEEGGEGGTEQGDGSPGGRPAWGRGGDRIWCLGRILTPSPDDLTRAAQICTSDSAGKHRSSPIAEAAVCHKLRGINSPFPVAASPKHILDTVQVGWPGCSSVD